MLDADIYGHSIPHILGIHQRPVAVDQMIVPPVKDDLKLMSIGFFLETSNEPVMWRGPMLHRALEQFLTDVHWGEIDTLVVDMPPGTGDVSISLGQLLPRAEVVVVTTPQKLAQDVAARAAAMAQKTNMRLLGVVENMSGDVFGSGGGEELAGDLGVPLLGTVPLDPVLREQGDAGAPVVSARPDADVRAGDRPRSPTRSSPSAASRAGDRQGASSRRMSAARRLVEEAYALAQKSRAPQLRELIADDATWEPTAKRKWNPCRTPTRSSATLAVACRAGEQVCARARRSSSATTCSSGSAASVSSVSGHAVSGRRSSSRSSRCAGGKIVRMQDYAHDAGGAGRHRPRLLMA